MAIKSTSQEGKQALAGRLMLALRRSSAAGVLHGQTIARRVGVNSTDLECLDLILMSGPSSAGEIARHTGLTSGPGTGLVDRPERLGSAAATARPPRPPQHPVPPPYAQVVSPPAPPPPP